MAQSEDAYSVKRQGQRGYTFWEDAKGNNHRVDGPAVEGPQSKEWFWHGLRHREDGPAVEATASKRWYRMGKLHREDGPAVEENGQKFWYRNGKKMMPEQVVAVLRKIEDEKVQAAEIAQYKTGLDHDIKVRSIKRLEKTPRKT